MVHLIITDKDPKIKFKQLELAPSLYTVCITGVVLTATAVDHTYIIVRPQHKDTLINLTQGLVLATMTSDVPLEPEVYHYLTSRIRRSDL
tara:strand:+ start:56 stop:325 length:270 start_codon:yes stop_codon:yes gene_type:complete